MKQTLQADDLVGVKFVAEACSADQKTIHNWIEKGRAPVHFRTPGRHLRFRAEDVAIWLASHGFPVVEQIRHLVKRDTGTHES